MATRHGPSSGKPFLEVRLGAHFRFGHRVVDVDGFYDGDGTYRIRFMPDEIGACRPERQFCGHGALGW